MPKGILNNIEESSRPRCHCMLVRYDCLVWVFKSYYPGGVVDVTGGMPGELVRHMVLGRTA